MDQQTQGKHRKRSRLTPVGTIRLEKFRPDQSRIYDVLTDLIVRLRSCSYPIQFYEFQKQLFGHLYPVGERRSQCARNAKRIERGKSSEGDGLPQGRDSKSQYEWELEVYVYARLMRQLQTVGDALAWTVFGYDRRKIIALSSNSSPGPFSGKAGLDYELGTVERLWSQRQHFALLHDLTNCLRIADISEFTSDNGALLHEVKKNPHVEIAQMRRAQVAIDAVMSGGQLASAKGRDARFVQLSEGYKTNLSQLADLMHLTHQRGVQGMKLDQGRALVAMSFVPSEAGLTTDYYEQLRRWRTAKTAAVKRAGISKSHIFSAMSTDVAARSPVMAPFAIYPLQPRLCAMLICDFAIFESIISVDSLVTAGRNEGLDVGCLLPLQSSTIDQTTDVLRLELPGRSGITMHGASLNVLQYELLQPRTWARGIRELLELSNLPEEPALIFSAEGRAWTPAIVRLATRSSSEPI